MDRFTISKSEKQTIYEIYRACRLCGAGGGYRMPIVQNIVDLDSSEVELRQKIQDCLHLEVRPDDRMPPLICELCVDKVNDFYAFLELTRQTNIRTRTRLGLPLQTARRGENDPGDSILGVTEPLCVEPKKKSKAGPKCSKNIKAEEEVIEIKDEAEPASSDRGSRESSVSSRSSRARAATPPRVPRPIRALRTYAGKTSQVTTEDSSQNNKPAKRISSKELSDILQDQVNHEDNSLLVPRSYKRMLELEPPRPLLIPKRAKITPKELPNEPVRPVRLPTKLVKEPTKPLKEPTKTLKEPTKPLKEPTKPLKEPTKTLKEPTKSLRDLTKSAKELTQLVKEPAKSAKEPLKQPANEPTPPLRRKPGPKPKPNLIIPEPLKILKSKATVHVTPPKDEAMLPKPKMSCVVCKVHLKSAQGLGRHMKSHTPTFTKLQNACNPCGKWFSTMEDAAAHHRYHRSATFPYHCRRCFDDFRELRLYDEHIENNKCAATDAAPDVKCDRCWKEFPTRRLMLAHRCQGIEGRPGGNCPKCQRTYATLRSLKKHESMCNHRRKRDLIADPDVLRRLKPMQIRISRCDDLLNRTVGDYCDVSRVKPSYGLDKMYFYPYMSPQLMSKSLRSDRTAEGPIKHGFERDSFIHWDSENSDSEDVIKKVDSLSILSIKKLFSRSMLGKVPRKRRVNNETFDTVHDFGNMSNDINDIISSLGDDSNHFPNDIVGRSMNRNMNEQLRISLNHIIGIPDVTTCNVDLVNDNEVYNESNVVRNDSTEKSDMETENVDSIVNNDVRNETTEKGVLEKENEVSIENIGIRNESIDTRDSGKHNDVRIENNVRNDSTEKSDLETENEVSNENNDRNDSTEKCDLETENEVGNENNDDRNDSTEKCDLETEYEDGDENNDVGNYSTEKCDLETENEVGNENNDDRNASTEKSDLETEYEDGDENNDVGNYSTEKCNLETENEVGNENNDDRNASTEKSDLEIENEVGNENNDDRNDSTEKCDLETEYEDGDENNDVGNYSTEKCDLKTENEVGNENNDRNASTEKSDLVIENEVGNENNDDRNESTEKCDLETEYEVSNENTKNESSKNHDSGTENVSAEISKNKCSENNDLGTENAISNNDVQHDISEIHCETGLSDSDISNRNNNLNNEHSTNAVAEEGVDNDNSNLSGERESNTSNGSTKFPLIDIDSQDGLHFNDEKASGEMVETGSNDMEINNSEYSDTQSDDFSNLDLENRREIDKNETCRLDKEAINNFERSEVSVNEVSLQNFVDNKSEMITVEDLTANGIIRHEIENNDDNDPKINYDCTHQSQTLRDFNSVVHKESPIKHSIENLIGDTDKNPDKYIKEVISSIEDIIMKNPKNDEETPNERVNGEKEFDVSDIDDQKLMDALDAHIGEDKTDNDKITLEDLLPREDRPMALDDISEDFNFDA